MITRRKFITSTVTTLATGTTMLKSQAQSANTSSTFKAPNGACDCHVHVVSPDTSLYPMVVPRVYTPPPADLEKLKAHLQRLTLSRVVIIQPSFYGTDNRFILESTQRLGASGRAVVVIDKKTSDVELQKMIAMGARGVRMNIETSKGGESMDAIRLELRELAQRIKDFKLHIQIYATAKTIAALANEITASPVPVVLDHFAGVQANNFHQNPDLGIIVDLLKSNNVYIKLSGIYRISQQKPDYEEVKDLANLFIQTNANRLVWGSDWPHTNTIKGTPFDTVTPYREVDDPRIIHLLPTWTSDSSVIQKILVQNPEHLYRF